MLAGCNLGPVYQRPPMPVPAAFAATSASGARVWPDPGWWHGFANPELDALIAEARVHNDDLLVAIAQVRQADAAAEIAGAPLLPSISGAFEPNLQHTTPSVGGGSFLSSTGAGYAARGSSINAKSFVIAGSSSFELDFWGKNLALALAAHASAIGSRFDQQTVALTVVASVANTYFTALGDYDQITVQRQNLADALQTLDVVKGRLAVGTDSALDEAQEVALVAGLRASIPALESILRQEVIALGILVGRPPETIRIGGTTLVGMALPDVAPGLPSELLLRRPDVAYAEAQLVAQNQNVRAARAAFFPSIVLTGQGGGQSLAFATLAGPGAAFGSLAATISQPIFDNGLLEGQLGETRALYDQLAALYHKAILQAFTDVETALTAWQFDTQQETLQRQAVAAAQQSATIARAQMEAGTVDITTLLTTQQTLYADQTTLAQVRLARVLSLVSLYQALGGGWQQDMTLVGPIPGSGPGSGLGDAVQQERATDFGLQPGDRLPGQDPATVAHPLPAGAR